jgi:hypothetical protein
MLLSGVLAGAALAQGPINVNETGLHDGEFVYGIDGTAFSTPWTNSDVITVLGSGELDSELYPNVMFSLYGIYSGANVTNQAAIDVSGVGGNAFSNEGTAYASVNVYGIFGNPDGDVEVTNSGDITVTAQAGYAESTDGTANALASVYGISANHTLTNSGVIDVSAIAGTATATATSGYTYASAMASAAGLRTNGDVINDGQITVNATGGTANSENLSASASVDASGIYAYSGVVNTANIAASATGGTTNAEGSGYAGATAYGIRNSSETVDNSGDITVTATGGEDNEESSPNATAYGIQATGVVINSGDINVTAEAQDDKPAGAYGIYMQAEFYEPGPDNEITNTGMIRAFGDNAYELYIASGTTRIVDTYNVTLDGNPNVPSIFVAGGATLNLNNALLTVTDVQGDVAGATQWNTEYHLFNNTEDAGTVSGNFSSVSAVNPDVTAYYYTHSTANANDDTVSLGYAPQASEALASSSVEKRVAGMGAFALNQHMTMDLLYDTLALDELDEGSDDDSTGDTAQKLSACQRSGGAFFQPNYSIIEKDNDPLGYEAGMSGVSGGYSQCVNSSLLGLHVGYGKANINYTGTGYSANTEDQEVVTTGFSGMTRFRPWIFRYGFTGFRGWHEYGGLTGTGLTETETAKFDSYGGTGLFMVGRTFKHNRHVFLPEIGANWLWVHRESYTTEASDPAWDTTYSTINDNDVWAQAALNWQSLYKYKKIQITPFASIGIRQLLTDGETEVWQSVPGAARVQVEDEQDETAVALASSVVLRGRRTALTFAYDGEYSSDIQQHNFWMKFRLRF